MKFKGVEKLGEVKKLASNSKELALNKVNSAKYIIKEAVSNKSSVRSSLKAAGSACLEVGGAIPKGVLKLAKLDLKGSFNEVLGIFSGATKLAGAPVSLARSGMTSATNKFKKSAQVLGKVKNIPIMAASVITKSANVVSELLPAGSSEPKPAKQPSGAPASSEKKPSLSESMLPGVNEGKVETSAEMPVDKKEMPQKPPVGPMA